MPILSDQELLHFNIYKENEAVHISRNVCKRSRGDGIVADMRRSAVALEGGGNPNIVDGAEDDDYEEENDNDDDDEDEDDDDDHDDDDDDDDDDDGSGGSGGGGCSGRQNI